MVKAYKLGGKFLLKPGPAFGSHVRDYPRVKGALCA